MFDGPWWPCATGVGTGQVTARAKRGNSADYIEYNDINPFQLLQFQAAIQDFGATHAETAKLTALAQYFTPYRYLDGSPALLSFGLGKEVDVQAIIGIPTLKQWGSSIILDDNQLHCRNLKEAFPLIYERV